MAPFGPAPEMVGNEMSFSRPVSRRKVSSAATASISVSLPSGASRSSQARKRATAAPSRRCAARAPAISACVLDRLHQRDRIGAARGLPPLPATIRGARRRRWPDRGARVLCLSARVARKVVGARRWRVVSSGAHRVGELASVDIERGPALRGNDREGQRAAAYGRRRRRGC